MAAEQVQPVSADAPAAVCAAVIRFSYLHSNSNIANGYWAVSESICNLLAWRSLVHFIAFSCFGTLRYIGSNVMNPIFHSGCSIDCHVQHSSPLYAKARQYSRIETFLSLCCCDTLCLMFTFSWKNVECLKCMLCLLDNCTLTVLLLLFASCVELKLDASSEPLRGDLRGGGWWGGGVGVGGERLCLNLFSRSNLKTRPVTS